MNRNRATTLIGLSLAGLPWAAGAQTPRALPSLPEIMIDVPVLPPPAPDGAMVHEVELELGGPAARVVKGAPYCADAVHETVQPLLDADGNAGNRIVRQYRTGLCRDGEGRTRQEVERGGRKMVYLSDPVAGEEWVLDSQRKTARGLRSDPAAWRDYAERLREWARGLAERVRPATAGRAGSAPATAPAPPAPGVGGMPGGAEIVTIVREAKKQADAAQREVDVRVLRMHGAPGAGPSLLVPPPVSWTAAAFAPRGPGVVSPLGSKEIEGLRVNGERTRWIIDAGKVGNDKPIVIVREVWTSPDLVLTVQSRDHDPRRGETNYRLTNLRRGEPDPALMKVPADYSRSTPPAGR